MKQGTLCSEVIEKTEKNVKVFISKDKDFCRSYNDKQISLKKVHEEIKSEWLIRETALNI